MKVSVGQKAIWRKRSQKVCRCFATQVVKKGLTEKKECDTLLDDGRSFFNLLFILRLLLFCFVLLPFFSLFFLFLQSNHYFLQAAFETYHLMSEKWFIHASPTLFHAGTCQPQLSSCFLLTMKEDSIGGIYDTLKQVHRSGGSSHENKQQRCAASDRRRLLRVDWWTR